MFVSRSEVSAFRSIQRDSRVTGANAMSASFAGSGPRRRALRTNASRAGPVVLAGEHGIPAASPARRSARARPSADRRAARAAAPSTAASSRPPSRARPRSSSPARVFPLRRTWPETPAGPTAVRSRTSAARPASPAVRRWLCGALRQADAIALIGAVIRNCLRVFMGGQRSDVSGQRSAVRGQRSAVGCRMSDVRFRNPRS